MKTSSQFAGALLLSFCLPAVAQNSPQYTLTSAVIASGGGTLGAGPYNLSSTIGQPVASPVTINGPYSLGGGFWSQNGPDPVAAPAGMVAWWPGNGNPADLVNGNNGTLTNGVGYVAGEVGQAFNPTNNHAGIFIGNPAVLQLQNLTIEAWVKRASLSYVSDDPSANGGAASLFYFGSQGYGMGMHTDGAISLTKIDVDDVNDDAAGARVTDVNWHHVAVTKSGATVSFYIDGVAYPPVNYTSTFQFNTPCAIGVRGDNINANNNDSFAGAIDELAIYNRALTAAEIQSIYNAGTAGKVPVVPPTNVWITATGGSWAAPGNWFADVTPQGAGVTADFSSLTLGSDAYVTLDSATTIGNLIFGDQGNAHNWHLNPGTGGPLTLSNGPAGVTVRNQSAVLSVSLAGSQGLTKYGNGTLELVPPAGYTGGTTNNAGLLQIDGNFNTVSNRPLVINAGAVASGATLYLNVSQNLVTGSTNVTGAGTLRLIGTANGPASPDLNFGNDAVGVTYFGAQMDMGTLDLGASQRYVYATSGHNSVARWRNWEDARINGNIIGAGGITYIAQNNNAGANGNQPMECPLVLAGSNTFAGALEIQRGSVYLLNPNALTQTNQVLMDPVAGHNAKFFLYGNNPAVANLASSGAGNTLIANGNVENNTAPIPAGTLTVWETANTVFGGALVDTNYEYDAFTAPEYPSAPLALVKTGPGTLTLTGASTYTGPTTISSGTLAVNGSLVSPVTIASGGTLAGTGSLAGAVTVNGRVAPGNGGAGALATGAETWNPAGGLNFVMTNATASGGVSLLNINGGLNLSATPASPFIIHLLSQTAAQTAGAAGNFNPAVSGVWTLAATTAGITGFAAQDFAVDTSGFVNPFTGAFSVTTNGNALQLTYTVGTPAPFGMVAWWPANNNAVDVVGGDNGSLTNGVTYVPGEVQQAFDFNADSAMVLLSNAPALQLQNFTVEAWIQRGSAASVTFDGGAVAGNALMFGYGDSGYSFGLGPNGNLLLTWVDHDDVVSTAAVTDTNWHHVAVTTTNGTVVFYLDGAAWPASGYLRAYSFATAPAIGGRADNLNRPNNDSFRGSIDELAVYNNALTAAEIQSIYHAGAAGKAISAVSDYVVITGNQLGAFNWQTGEYTALGTLNEGSGLKIEDLAHLPGGVLYGVDSAYNLVSVNPATLQVSVIGAIGYSIAGMAVRSDGVTFGFSHTSLYLLNTNTGAATLVGNLGANTSLYYDAKFDAGGNLYFMENNQLYTVNTTTGGATLLGSIGYSMYGLGFENGTLYGFTTDGRILTLNTATGAGTPLVNQSQSNPIFAASSGGLSVGVSATTVPALSITASGANLVIAWPAAGNYTVQQTANLAVATSWITSPNSVSTSNGTNSITITPALTGNMFYRLVSQ